MDDFLRQLKENLDNREETPFEEAAWAHLERQLHPAKPGRRAWLPWAAAAAAVLLIGSNAWLYQRINQLQRDLSARVPDKDTIFLQNAAAEAPALAQAQQRPAPTLLPSGQSKGSKAPASPSFSKPSANQAPIDPTLTPSHSAPSDSQDPPIAAALPFGQSSTDAPAHSPMATLRTSTIATQPLSPQSMWHSKSANAALSTDMQPLRQGTERYAPQEALTANGGGQQKAPRLALRDWLLPDAYGVSLQAGISAPVARQDFSARRLGAGIALSATYASGLELSGSIAADQLRLNAPHMADNNGFPLRDNPSGDVNFRQGAAEIPLLSTFVGLRYKIPTGTQFKPLLGADYGMAWRQPYTARYEYEVIGTGQSLSRDVAIEEVERVPHLANVSAGLELSLDQAWQWRTEVSYQMSLANDNPAYFGQFLGISTGITYRL